MDKDYIKKIRLAAGDTQLSFALRLNVNPQTVSRWERGVVSPQGDSRERLSKLALKLGIHKDGHPPGM